MNYTNSDKLEFQGRDKRIAFEKIFGDLLVFYKGEGLEIKLIATRAKELVEWLFETYPLVEIKDEPFPTVNRAPIKGNPPLHCPECGADVKHKSGVSKAGKPYDFIGCSAFPECNWTYKK